MRMQTNMEKIQEMLKLHENIVLFQPKGRFGAVFLVKFVLL